MCCADNLALFDVAAAPRRSVRRNDLLSYKAASTVGKWSGSNAGDRCINVVCDVVIVGLKAVICGFRRTVGRESARGVWEAEK